MEMIHLIEFIDDMIRIEKKALNMHKPDSDMRPWSMGKISAYRQIKKHIAALLAAQYEAL